MRKGRPAPFSELLGEFLRQPEIRRGLLAGRVLALWPKVVGPELARLTRAEGFRQGVLQVAVKDHVLAHQLAYQKPAILTKYAHELGAGVVREVRFLARSVLAPAPPPANEDPVPPPLDPDAEAWLLEVVRPLPDALKRSALKVGRGVLRRVRASPRCPVCGGPTEEAGQPCLSCRLRMELPLVRAEADRLVRGEAPRLSGDLAAAARHRALGLLEAALRRLAEAAVEDPRRVPELLDTALAYLRLKIGREPRPADLVHLPPPVRSLFAIRLGHRS